MSKDYIKSPSVPAMSARSSGCYLLAIYWQKYCRKNYRAVQIKVWEDSHAYKIPMNSIVFHLSQCLHSRVYKRKLKLFSLLPVYDLKSCICSVCIPRFHYEIWADLKNWTGFSTRSIHYHSFFGHSQDKCFLTESLE